MKFIFLLIVAVEMVAAAVSVYNKIIPIGDGCDQSCGVDHSKVLQLRQTIAFVVVENWGASNKQLKLLGT